MALKVGQIIAERFEIISSLCSESNPSIFKALDLNTHLHIAIKVIATSACTPEKVEAVTQKFQIVKSFQHDNIAEIYELYHEQGILFYTLELCEGESIFSRLRNEINPQECQLWVEQMQSCLQTFHDNDCLLGEIRLDKILIDIDNNLHVMDFASDETNSSAYKASPIADLRSPAQREGEIATASSDVYALGMFIELMVNCVNQTKVSKKEKASLALLLRSAKKILSKKRNTPLKIDVTPKSMSDPSWIAINAKALLVACFGLVVVLGVFVLNHETGVSSPSKGQQFTIVFSQDFQPLGSIASALEYPLANIDKLAITNTQTSLNLSDKLLLKPSKDERDRAKLIDAFDLDYLLSLSSKQTSNSTYTLTASLFSKTSSDPITQISERVSNASLNNDLLTFSLSTLNMIEVWSGSSSNINYEGFIAQVLRLRSQGKPNFGLLKSRLDDYAEVYYELASQYIRDGRIEKAKETLQEAQGKAFTNSYWSFMIEQLVAKLANQPETQLNILDQLIQQYPRRANLILEKAKILIASNRILEAQKALRSALTFQGKDGQILLLLAKIKMQSNELQEAIDNELANAQHSFRQRNDVTGESKVKSMLAEAYYSLGQKKTARRLLVDTLGLLNELEFASERSALLMQLASMDTEDANWQAADRYLGEALTLFNRLGDDGMQWTALYLLAELDLAQGLYESAADKFEVAYQFAKREANQVQTSKSVLALSQSLLGAAMLDRASTWLFNTIDADLLNEKDLKTQLSQQLEFYLFRGELGEAESIAKQLSSRLKNITTIDRSAIELARFKFVTGNLTGSLSLLDTIKNSSNNTSRQIKASAFLLHSEVCLMIADFTCAQANNQQAITYLDKQDKSQQAIHFWLTMAISKGQGKSDGLSPDLLFNYLNTNNLNLSTHIKILIDVQERFDLPFNSQYVSAIKRLNRPVFKLFMLESELSFAKDTGDFSTLNTLASSLGRYWKAHYIQRLLVQSGESSSPYQSLETQWFTQLSDLQVNAYKKYYY